jgi:hypothetical protein
LYEIVDITKDHIVLFDLLSTMQHTSNQGLDPIIVYPATSTEFFMSNKVVNNSLPKHVRIPATIDEIDLQHFVAHRDGFHSFMGMSYKIVWELPDSFLSHINKERGATYVVTEQGNVVKFSGENIHFVKDRQFVKVPISRK